MKLMVGARVDPATAGELASRAAALGVSPSDVVRLAIASYLGQAAPVPTLARLADLEGRLAAIEQWRRAIAG